VSGGPHQGIEVRGEWGMCGQVVPERPPEDLVVCGRAGADRAQQTPPRVRHPAPDALQIEPEPCRRIQQQPGGLVQRKASGVGLVEHAFADEMPQDTME
jgi:hypothetical protein